MPLRPCHIARSLNRCWRIPGASRCVAHDYEVKWDGFRAIVSTEALLRVRSRRGWDMAPHLDFLAQLPVRSVFDGELVAFGADGKPDFPSLCERMLHRHVDIPVTFVSSTCSGFEGATSPGDPMGSVGGSSARSAWLDRTGGCPRHSMMRSDLGRRCEQELEGVVATRVDEPYRSGERTWVKVKNRSYWRYELEREGALRRRIVTA